MLTACAVPLNSTRQDLLGSPGLHALPAEATAPDVRGALLLDVRLDRQLAGNACGAHVSASLLDYWFRVLPSPEAKPPSGAELYRRQPPSSPDGYSLEELVRLLEAQGLAAVGVRSTQARLRAELQQGRPAIVRVGLEPRELLTKTVWPTDTPWLGRLAAWLSQRAVATMYALHPRTVDHFWLVAGQTPTHLLVVDPMMGLRQVELDHFDRVWKRGGQLAVVSGGWTAAERGGGPRTVAQSARWLTGPDLRPDRPSGITARLR